MCPFVFLAAITTLSVLLWSVLSTHTHTRHCCSLTAAKPIFIDTSTTDPCFTVYLLSTAKKRMPRERSPGQSSYIPLSLEKATVQSGRNNGDFNYQVQRVESQLAVVLLGCVKLERCAWFSYVVITLESVTK